MVSYSILLEGEEIEPVVFFLVGFLKLFLKTPIKA